MAKLFYQLSTVKPDINQDTLDWLGFQKVSELQEPITNADYIKLYMLTISALIVYSASRQWEKDAWGEGLQSCCLSVAHVLQMSHAICFGLTPMRESARWLMP